MTAISGPVWDEERNGWISPDGTLVPAERAGGRELPDQGDRAEPFGIVYEVDEPADHACTCETELLRTFDGAPFLTTRYPDPDDPCPLPGHDEPERTRRARH